MPSAISAVLPASEVKRELHRRFAATTAGLPAFAQGRSTRGRDTSTAALVPAASRAPGIIRRLPETASSRRAADLADRRVWLARAPASTGQHLGAGGSRSYRLPPRRSPSTGYDSEFAGV